MSQSGCPQAKTPGRWRLLSCKRKRNKHTHLNCIKVGTQEENPGRGGLVACRGAYPHLPFAPLVSGIVFGIFVVAVVFYKHAGIEIITRMYLRPVTKAVFLRSSALASSTGTYDGTNFSPHPSVTFSVLQHASEFRMNKDCGRTKGRGGMGTMYHA